MSIITIIGAGMMGSAIGVPAADNGNEVRLVGTPLDSEIIRHAKQTGEHLTLKRQLPGTFRYFPFEDLDIALEQSELIVSAVSSFGVEWFAQNVLKKISNVLPILILTKGMYLEENGSLITYPEYYTRQFPDQEFSFNAVGGPCTSYELVDHDQTEVCFAGSDPLVLAGLREIFETDYYHVSTSTDLTGLEVAAAMKNAYALAVCMAVGLSEAANADGHPNYNSQAALFGQGVREIMRLLEIYGGGAENIVYAAGDMYVTIFGGRTRKLGILLGKGTGIHEAMEELKDVTLESAVIAERTAKAVRTLIAQGKASAEEFPLMVFLDQVINKGQQRVIPWSLFEVQAN
ncbi:MAG: glycerol-3-phosphate dehydrogenase [Clostridia bacterium]|nr:glycerol-3-phosphate dehydrogenase [Clostridia bacterium]